MKPPRGRNKPLRPRDGKTFQRQSASWSTTMKPHGSRAGYEPLRAHYASSAPRMLGVHQPLTIEAGQSPPNKVRVLKARCSSLSFRKNPELLTFFSRFLADENQCCSKTRESAPRPDEVSRSPLHIRSCRTSRPAAVAGNPGCGRPRKMQQVH